VLPAINRNMLLFRLPMLKKSARLNNIENRIILKGKESKTKIKTISKLKNQ
jgi:hypothetical protein